MTSANGEITRMLFALREGDSSVETRLLEGIYGELRRLARFHMQRERPGHTLSATALVHEAYLKLIAGEAAFKDRVHFFALASSAMRQILVDHARRKTAGKRGGGVPLVNLDGLQLTGDTPDPDNIELLDRALTRLAAFAPRQARIVEMRYFGGMTSEEVAGHLDLSVRTIHREWVLAKAWLYGELRTP